MNYIWIIISVLFIIGYAFLFFFGSKRIKKFENDLKEKRLAIHKKELEKQEEERKQRFKNLMSDFQERKLEYDKLIEEVSQKADIEKIRYKRLTEDLEEEFKKKKQYEIEQFNLILEQNKRYLDQQKERDVEIAEENKKKLQQELEVYRKVSEEKILRGFKEMQFFEQKRFEDFLMELTSKKEKQVTLMNEEITCKKNELQDYKNRVAAANEAFRLQQLKEQEWETHHLLLTDHQKGVIDKLIQIGEDFPEVRESLRKIIWSDFLLKALNEMIRRQFGAESPSNIIYCIEDETGKYIGKTAQTARKRWEEHIKTSLEIGKTPQKIHRALYKNWDKFSFSVLDKCTAEELSEKEKYWINFYGSKDYGYNMKG